MLFLMALLADAQKLPPLAVAHRQRKVGTLSKLLHMVDDHGAAIFALCFAKLALMTILCEHELALLLPLCPGVKPVFVALCEEAGEPFKLGRRQKYGINSFHATKKEPAQTRPVRVTFALALTLALALRLWLWFWLWLSVND